MERGATLVESLSKVHSSGLPFAAPKSTLRPTESVLVRDVLQMLQGFSSTWFYWDENEQRFRVKKGLHVSHLSQSSLNCILYRFMHAATCLHRVEAFVKQVETASCSGILKSHTEAPPTLQAFANAVSARLKCLRKSALEKELESAGTAAGTTVTLLSLVDSLSRVCAGAEFLLQLVNGVIPSSQLENAVVAAELATHILDYLYENLNEFCLVQDGEDEPYHTSLLLFIGSLRPLIESLDSWLHEGTLSDPFGELFFCANGAIAVEDSAFWEQGYFMHQWESGKVDSMFHSTGLNGALENNERKGVKGNDSPKESSLDGKSTNFKSRDQSPDQRGPVCPIFIQPIARAIVSAGKSLQLLRHVQREHAELSERVDAYRKSSLGNYENSVSSAIWVPLFPQFLNRKTPLDTGLHQHTSAGEKVPDLEQRFLDKNDSPLSLFENFSATLVRLLGYGSSISKNYYYDLQSLVFPGKVCRFFTTKEDSVAKSGDDVSKVRMLQGSCWNLHLDVTAENFQQWTIKMDSGFLKSDSRDLSLLPSSQSANEVSESTNENRLNDPSQTGDASISESKILFRPENAAFSVSARELQQQNECWNIELNLSKCCLLPSLNDEYLRKAVYSENDNDTGQNSELGRDNTDEIGLEQKVFTGCGDHMVDSSLNTLNGTNFAYGFGFGKTVMHHINTDSEALELLYPYPTLLPRVQENSHVSELLPSQRSSSLASRILDWLQNIKLKATPLPMVLVQECLISFIQQQVDHVGQQILSKLMDEWRLMDELAVLRAIYLFGSGDLLQQFCSVLFNKLDRGEPWDDYYELNTMLQESIRSSADGMLLPSLDSLVVTISPRSNGALEQGFGTIPLQLMGRGSGFGIDTLDSLWFAYKVAWPLELIADQVAIKKYNQVMAFLIKVKRAKFVLDKARRWMWKEGGSDVPNHKRHMLLQQKLMHFVNTFHQYVMDRVLYSAWIELCQGMASAGSLDEVIACHEAYLVSIQRQCFVAPDKLWALIASRVKTILGLALEFYSVQHTLCSGGAAPAIKARCQMEVDRIGHQFDECIVFLLRVLSFKLNVGHFPHLVDLVTRINYNYYYMSETGHLLTPLPETNYSKGSQTLRTNLYNQS